MDVLQCQLIICIKIVLFYMCSVLLISFHVEASLNYAPYFVRFLVETTALGLPCLKAGFGG